MLDRSRGSSSLIALAIASVGVFSACEQGKPDDVTRTARPLTTGLQAGDVAITCFDTQNPDSLQITPLVPLDANSVIQYTDREANADGVFNTNDEAVDQNFTFTSALDAGTIPAGTTFTFIPTTGLNNGTEQVFLYQGHIGTDVDGGSADAAVEGPNTQLIWGMQVDPTGTWVPRNDAANLSDLPTSLNGHALVLPSSGDAGAFGAFYYDTTKGPIHGTKAVLQAAFENAANWTSVAGPVVCSSVVTATFTVDPDVIDSGTDVPIGSGGAGGAGGSDGGTAGMTGTADGAAGSDGSVADTGAGGSTDGSVADSGVGGSTDAAVDTGAGGAGGGPSGSDSGAADVKADTGTDAGTTTDAKTDTGTTTDAKTDTGTTTDAKVDTGTKVDTGVDSGKTTSSSSGCSCSTASTGQNLSASVSLLALVGIVMTTRRRRRR